MTMDKDAALHRMIEKSNALAAEVRRLRGWLVAETRAAERGSSMTVKIGGSCKSQYQRAGGNQPGDRIVRCELEAGHAGDHEEVFTGSTWPQAGIDQPRSDDWKTTLKVPDSPKMLRETLCAVQSVIDSSTGVTGRRAEHVGRLQRLIDECDRHRPLGPDGKHGDRHTPTCGCVSFELPGPESPVRLVAEATGNPLQPVYDAVFEVIEDHPSGATDDYGLAVENARVWRAVDAALGAMGIER